MTTLNLEPLQKAINQLNEGLKKYKKHPEDDLLRDGVIQRFKYTYELSWKTLKRFIKQTSATPEEVDRTSFPDLIRTGSELSLLHSSWDKWSDFRKGRGATNHTYDEVKAKEVFTIIPSFLEEATYLLKQLNKRIFP